MKNKWNNCYRTVIRLKPVKTRDAQPFSLMGRMRGVRPVYRLELTWGQCAGVGPMPPGSSPVLPNPIHKSTVVCRVLHRFKHLAAGEWQLILPPVLSNQISGTPGEPCRPSDMATWAGSGLQDRAWALLVITVTCMQCMIFVGCNALQYKVIFINLFNKMHSIIASGNCHSQMVESLLGWLNKSPLKEMNSSCILNTATFLSQKAALLPHSFLCLYAVLL